MRWYQLFLFVMVAVVCRTSYGQRVYVDDEDQRRLADLQFEAYDERADQPALRIRVRAVGPQVDPIIGYRGIFGANRYTAEELSLIAAGRRSITVETRYANGFAVAGYAIPGQRGRIPERSIQANGRIRFSDSSQAEQLLELNVETAATRPGRRVTSIYIDGQLRFRVRWDLRNGQPDIQGVESVGNDYYLASRLPRGLQAQANGRAVLLVADKKKLPPPISRKEWKTYDREGRWLLFKRGITAKPDSLPAWIQFLGDQREFELLEWIALYEPDAFKTQGVGDLLFKKGAPQWLRVAIWQVNAPFSISTGHSRQTANDLVVNMRPGTSLDYLLKNRAAIENWKPGVLTCLQQLMKAEGGVVREDSSRLLPPLKSANVFAALYPTGAVKEFGTARRAEPDVVYVHQVVRAIQGMVVMNHGNVQRLAQLRKLTAHENEEIQHAALLAFTVFAPRTPGTEEFRDFRELMTSPSATPRIQEAALMAWSYHDHPAVLLKLHELALDPAKEIWSAAVSRIGDLGQAFSAPLLATLDRSQLDAQQTQLLDSVVKRLRDRYQAKNLYALNEAIIRKRFRLAAFATATQDALAELVREWAVVSCGRLVPQVRSDLATWRPPAKPDFWLPVDYEKYTTAWKDLQQQALQRQ